MATLNSTKINGTLRTTSTLTITGEGNYNNFNEGIRLHTNPINNWAAIVLCGADNTGDAGTSANTWGMYNHNGDFYITRNGSSEYASDLSTNAKLSNDGTCWRFDGMVNFNRFTSSKLTTVESLALNTAATFGGEASKTNINISTTSDYNSIITLIAGNGGVTNGTAIGFHNPNISSSTFGFVNVSSTQGYWKLLTDSTKSSVYIDSGCIKLNRKQDQWDAGQDGISADQSALWLNSSNRQFGFSYAGTDGYIFKYSQFDSNRYIDLPTSEGLLPVLGSGYNTLSGDEVFNISNTFSSSTDYTLHHIRIYSPNASNAQSYFDFGRENSAFNSGHIDFHYVSAGNRQNYIAFGLHSANRIFKIYGNGTAVLRHLAAHKAFGISAQWDEGLYIQDSAATGFSCLTLGDTEKNDLFAMVHNSSKNSFYFETKVDGNAASQVYFPTSNVSGGGVCVVTGYSNGVLSLRSTV